MGNFENEDLKRVVDAHTNKKQMITPELQNKVNKQALDKRKSIFNLITQKKVLFSLFSSLLVVVILGIFLFVLKSEPFKQPMNESILGATNGAETDKESVNMNLFLHIVNSSLVAVSAISKNDFEILKTVIVSNATIDETNQTVTFPLETPFVVETKYFPPFALSDLKIVGYDERGSVDPILIIRIEEHTYEVMFSKDEASNGEYRILSLTGNR